MKLCGEIEVGTAACLQRARVRAIGFLVVTLLIVAGPQKRWKARRGACNRRRAGQGSEVGEDGVCVQKGGAVFISDIPLLVDQKYP